MNTADIFTQKKKQKMLISEPELTGAINQHNPHTVGEGGGGAIGGIAPYLLINKFLKILGESCSTDWHCSF